MHLPSGAASTHVHYLT